MHYYIARTRTTCTAHKVDSKNICVLLSSHCFYCLKNVLVQQCPHKGHIGNPSTLVNSNTRGTSLNPKKQLLNITMQSATTTLIQVGKGWNTGGVYRLQDTQSTSLKQISRLSCLSWSKPSSLFPTELTFSLALPLQSHHTFTTMLCLGFELEVPTHAGQATPAHTYLGLIPELGYAKSIKYWLNDRMAELFY